MKKQIIWKAVAKKSSGKDNIAFYVAIEKGGQFVFLQQQKDETWDVVLATGITPNVHITKQKNCKNFNSAKRWAARHFDLCEWREVLKCRAQLMGYTK